MVLPKLNYTVRQGVEVRGGRWGGTSEGVGGWRAGKGRSEEKRGLTLEKRKTATEDCDDESRKTRPITREITQHCLIQWLFCSESSVLCMF